MEAQRLSQLIGLIYESAQDLELWPLLLQGLAEQLYRDTGVSNPFPQVEKIENLGDYVSHWYENQLDDTSLQQSASLTQAAHFSSQENEMIQMLLPHLVRAVELNRQLQDMTVDNEAFASVLEHLPIGMVVTDVDGRVYAKNRCFDEQLNGDGRLRIHAGRLGISVPEEHKQLTALMRDVVNSSQDSEPLQSRALRLTGAKPVSLLISPFVAAENLLSSPRIIIFVAANAAQVKVEPKSLQAIYGLSRAESRLTVAIVNGQSLEEIAELYHVSKHTLRTQLKSIYRKTDCRRQAELVVKVLTSPAILTSHKQDMALPQVLLQDIRLDEDERHNQKMYLSDGRCLSFAEYGAEDGYPVVMMHGLSGSRFQVHRDEDILRRHGIRLYIPERPGFGGSDRLQERTILDWSQDLEQFLDFLGAKQVALIGYSVGGCFALACAHQLKERISHLTLLSSMGPFKTISDLDGMLPMFRMMLGLGRFTPSIAMSFMRLAVKGMRKHPELYYKHVIDNVPEVDKDLFRDAELKHNYISSTYESVRQGERDMMLEQLLIARDWGFELNDIKVPVSMWHGTLDNFVPQQMARDLAARLPDADINLIPGAGHLLLYRIWDDVVSSITEQLMQPVMASA